MMFSAKGSSIVGPGRGDTVGGRTANLIEASAFCCEITDLAQDGFDEIEVDVLFTVPAEFAGKIKAALGERFPAGLVP